MRARSEGGFTLVELLVVITILTVVGGIVTSSVVRSLHVTRRAQERAESTATLQNTIQRMGREIRAADPLLIDETMDISQHIGAEVHRNGERHVVTYRLDGGDLVTDRTEYDAAGNVVSSGTGALLVDDVATVLFEYFDDVYDDADGDGRDDPLSCDYQADVACLHEYRKARYVRLAIVSDLLDQNDQRIETLVTLRNPR